MMHTTLALAYGAARLGAVLLLVCLASALVGLALARLLGAGRGDPDDLD